MPTLIPFLAKPNECPAARPDVTGEHKSKTHRRLLIVDDQVGLAKIIGLVAKQAGYEFMIVNAPRDAAQAFLDFKPDVIMVDMIMPEMDGIEVLNQILLARGNVRVILTSGYGSAYLRLGEAVAEFHDMGTVSVLKKPFRREELMDLLASVSAELD